MVGSSEQWRAQSTDGSAIPAGTTVRVADIRAPASW